MGTHSLLLVRCYHLMKLATKTVSTSYNGLPLGRCNGNWVVVRLSEGCLFRSNTEYAVCSTQ